MNAKVLNTLEYNKIIVWLAEQAFTPKGKKACLNLEPMADLDQIRKAQKDTSAALTRILRHGRLSFSGVRDIGEAFKRLEVGSSLNATELLYISAILRVSAQARAYDRNEDEQAGSDCLKPLFDSLEPLTPLRSEIDRCILSEEEINDDASPGLRKVRRAIQATGDKVHTQLNSVLNSSRNYLQDGVITMRNGRYCLPVKAEYKAQFQGMVHDQSASGSTFFIEPASVVRLNNELKELEIAEQKEIEAVLANLSVQAAEFTDQLKTNIQSLSELDFIFAKGLLSQRMKASEPEFNDERRIHLKQARHPLLDQQTVVPITVSLGETYDLLVITGPNTGGKTVSLKTVGLLTLMGQAGLHIPAFQGSSLGVFTEVFADIGDEQSIEQSLSTFSSHMTNIIHILDKADPDSLVLFDELGAGTDPTEGAALAISILTFLHNMTTRTMATTHYSELKVFALTTEGVENASCEFDVASLRPTYRLLVGIPGKSNAFAISRKLGLSEHIIEEARKHIDAEEESFEDLLSSLEQTRKALETEQKEAELSRKEVSALKKRLSDSQEKLTERRERLVKEANEEARQILLKAKDFADKTIRQVNKLTNDSAILKELEKERTSLRETIDGLDRKTAAIQKKKPKKKHQAKDFKIGDAVRVLSMNLNGTVSSLPNQKGNLYVQMGILRSQVHISDLELIEESTVSGPGLKSHERSSQSAIKMSKAWSISSEINIIGKTVDEAIPLVDKYLDDAYLAHMKEVRIIHGRGTGALKQGVHKLLKRLNYVESFRLGGFGEGDGGVTIAEFKQGKED